MGQNFERCTIGHFQTLSTSQCFSMTFTMFCKPNSTAKPSRLVRNIVNVLNACCTAANA